MGFHSPLTRPYLLGGWHWGGPGGTLDSHDKGSANHKLTFRNKRRLMMVGESFVVSHRIYGNGIFSYIYHKSQPNVGKYTTWMWKLVDD